MLLGGLAQNGEVSHNIVTWNSGQTTNRMTMIRMGNGGRNKDKGAKSCDWAGQEGENVSPGWKLSV